MSHNVILHDAARQCWLRFSDPRRLVVASSPEQVLSCLDQVTRAVDEEGLFAAGFLSYEAAPAFDPALSVRQDCSGFPLAWFGLYEEPDVIAFPPSGGDFSGLAWVPSVERSDYSRAIASIRQRIADGETYQVNYTMRLRSAFADDPESLFGALIHHQQADYGAYVDLGRYVICSASPELFFRLDGDRIWTRPMKGTCRRGLTLAEDKQNQQWLFNSGKNRAENLMIVDMMRNDLGRIAECGSVEVPHLFATERYPTVWQMTSTVSARTSASFTEVMKALFPCASITGAPKPHTMSLISELESTPRRVYTGSVGFVAPGRTAQFNVAIRTVLIDRQEGAAEYGVGGGVVWDSDSADEYAECMLKASVLTADRPVFSLLESLLWTPEAGFFLLDQHLNRLAASAEYFGFEYADLAVREALCSVTGALESGSGAQKVRLLIDREGRVSCESAALDTVIKPLVRLKLAKNPVDSSDPFLYHKTTHRRVYEQAKADWPEVDDVILWNERREVTEACIANIVVEIDGQRVTPPVASGLLGGTFREQLLADGTIMEGIVTLDMLEKCTRLFVVNSVRKWREAILV